LCAKIRSNILSRLPDAVDEMMSGADFWSNKKKMLNNSQGRQQFTRCLTQMYLC